MNAVERLLEGWRWRRSAHTEQPYGYRMPRQGASAPLVVALVLGGGAVGGWLGSGVGHGSAAPAPESSLIGAAAATPVPAGDFATRLEGAVHGLGVARTNGRLQLSGAGGAAAQAAAATKLAAAYRTAAHRLGPVAVGAPAVQARVLEALQGAAKAYAMLAAAARAGDTAGYARAAKAVGSAEAELQQIIGSRGSLA
ncbi:MAG: hypothetical protein QOE28_1327 [Solirubrobacteraceae bacterium]|nr:hypothetical protein [Solirubrobacteraceae bacterium]